VIGLLRAAVWDALAEEIDRRDGELVAAVTTRLAHVCDVVAQAALSGGQAQDGARDVRAGGADGPTLMPVPSPVLEFDGVRRGEDAGGDAPADAPPLEAVPDLAVDVVARRAADAGAEPWRDAIASRLTRHGEDGEPFAVLALEVDEAERMLAADTDGEALRAITWAEGAIRRAARGADAVLREHPGRLWVIAPVPTATAARQLGERLADTAAKVALRGAPLTVSIGIANVPDDGIDADALVAHADEGVFAARAAGVRLA
jgi:GGDEF domain-containing protein